MNKHLYPLLTDSQLKRFCRSLVDSGFIPSLTKARKATDTPKKCRDTFLQFIDYINLNKDFDSLAIDDILEAYVADDVDTRTIELNPIHNKAIQPEIELNPINNKIDQVATGTSPAGKKKRGGRGKQKVPAMAYYPFRLPESMLDELKGLGGPVSEHIRRAIALYLQAQVK